MTWEDELARCPLAAGPFPADARRCDWCGKGLEGRRRRWCSDACSYAYTENHAWTNARAAALRRDKVCQACGSTGRTVAEVWYRLLVTVICPRPTPPRLLAFCQANDWYPDHEEARDAYRTHVRRQQAPWANALELLDEHRRRHRLEVNHKTPCLGAHKENSCAHHVAGLEVLCHPCHLRVTARQRAAGLLRAG